MCAASAATKCWPVGEGRGEGGLEQRERAIAVPARSAEATAFQVDACAGDLARTRQQFRFHDQALARVERVPQALDARELGEDLGAALLRLLVRELLPELPLRAVEVVEVPERPEAVGHDRRL